MSIDDLKERLHQFHEWQQRPYEVAQMSDEEHECNTCGTRFVGNYCPRCGQSYKIGRYSFKNAFLLFLDVWGLGNRGMFRSLRDLLLRPGYMMRDYLSGMQMAYFPPFKMLFLLTALSLVVAHGLNIQGRTFEEQVQQSIVTIDEMDDDKGKEWAETIFTNIINVQQRFPNVLAIVSIAFLTLILYPSFRHCKSLPDLRFSEFLIAMVYMANMTSIYETVLTFFCASDNLVSMMSALVVIPLKQLSGYTWKRTIITVLLTFLAMFVFIILCTIAVVVVLEIRGELPTPPTV